MSQDTPSAANFGGTARLFPLPNFVLFPHVVQPLHIFEPRYRQLMIDALADDRLIAMALPQPGWEENYHKTPPIHSVVCLGLIHREERLSDGRYNLLLEGLWRARIREEVKGDRLYRMARVDLLQDEPAPASLEEQLRQEMGEKATPFFSAHPQAWEQMKRLIQSGLSLGELCDILCFALPLEAEIKQQLLDETRVEPRVRMLLRSLQDKAPPTASEPPKRHYPPDFSAN